MVLPRTGFAWCGRGGVRAARPGPGSRGAAGPGFAVGAGRSRRSGNPGPDGKGGYTSQHYVLNLQDQESS